MKLVLRNKIMDFLRAIPSIIPLVFALSILILIATNAMFFAVVKGHSMEPLLKDGDIVVVWRTKDIELGDIIVYKRGFRLVIHRVIAIIRCHDNTLLYVVKGDNNPSIDTPMTSCRVKEIDVYNRVGHRYPYLQFIGDYASGIPEDVILGKVVEVFNIPIKIPILGSINILK